MKSKNLSQIKNRLKHLLKDKEIIDIILFGSFVKGKTSPRDIDIALITEKKEFNNINGFHFSIISPKEFFLNPPTLVTTLLKEGYSLKNNKTIAENLRFQSKVLFTYSLNNLKNTEKVRIVQILRGKNNGQGLVEEYKGEWIANQVFTVPLSSEYILEKLFIKQRINFKKWNILIH